jgi:hypothetical protein
LGRRTWASHLHITESLVSKGWRLRSSCFSIGGKDSVKDKINQDKGVIQDETEDNPISIFSVFDGHGAFGHDVGPQISHLKHSIRSPSSSTLNPQLSTLNHQPPQALQASSLNFQPSALNPQSLKPDFNHSTPYPKTQSECYDLSPRNPKLYTRNRRRD